MLGLSHLKQLSFSNDSKIVCHPVSVSTDLISKDMFESLLITVFIKCKKPITSHPGPVPKDSILKRWFFSILSLSFDASI